MNRARELANFRVELGTTKSTKNTKLEHEVGIGLIDLGIGLLIYLRVLRALRGFKRTTKESDSLASWLLVLVTLALAAPAAVADCAGERERARAAATTIEREWPLRGADDVAAFVRAVGDRLARHAPAPPPSWTFVVVRNRGANAFAVGDGRIYVTDGAIDVCATEAELAAMLAHEMGHQLAGHFCAAAGNSGRRKRLGALVQHIDPAREREADRGAVQLLTAAGYDARAALTVASRIAERQPAGTQPDTARLDALRQLLEGVPPSGRSDSEEFRRLKLTVTKTEP